MLSKYSTYGTTFPAIFNSVLWAFVGCQCMATKASQTRWGSIMPHLARFFSVLPHGPYHSVGMRDWLSDEEDRKLSIWPTPRQKDGKDLFL